MWIGPGMRQKFVQRNVKGLKHLVMFGYVNTGWKSLLQ